MTHIAVSRPRTFVVICVLILGMRTQAQNRGVYPLGMSATNSGVTPTRGFTYVNQLLFYSRDHAKDDAGDTLTVTGENYVLMDLNTLAWVSKKKFLGGANFSAVATLPFAKNNLTSDIQGKISGGGGFADSYYMPFILGCSHRPLRRRRKRQRWFRLLDEHSIFRADVLSEREQEPHPVCVPNVRIPRCPARHRHQSRRDL
jgi:hypothetical protein